MRECHCHFFSAGSELPSADLGQEVITATATIIFSNVQSRPSHALRLSLAGKGTEMSALRNKNSPEMRARWIQSLPQLYPLVLLRNAPMVQICSWLWRVQCNE